MMQHNSQMRGQLVTKIPDLVQKLYGFKEDKSVQAIKYNRDLFKILKDEKGFYFKVQYVLFIKK